MTTMLLFGSRAEVLKGKACKTRGGLKANDLMKNKRGKIVCKKASVKGHCHLWILACSSARIVLKIRGMELIKKGTRLYKKAMQYHKELKKLYQSHFYHAG